MTDWMKTIFAHASEISKTASVAAAGAAGVTGLGLGIAGTAVYQTGKQTGYWDYKRPGAFTTFGFSMDSINAEGRRVMTGWGHKLTEAPGTIMGHTIEQTTEAAAFNGTGFSAKRLWAHRPGNAFGVLGTGYALYSGYQEGGFGGAYDAVALNVAAEAAIYKWGTGVGNAARNGRMLAPHTKLAGHPLTMTASGMARGLGAFAGGYVGQQIGLATGIPMAGTLGASLGSYVGAAPIASFMAHPILVGGTLTALAGAATAYGAYTVVKSGLQAGYEQRQGRKGINTDGNMAAFMTQNAITMRERAVQAISKSHQNSRSAIGLEGNFMHSSKNYNSSYR